MMNFIATETYQLLFMQMGHENGGKTGRSTEMETHPR
jgi:hypothetical protein